MAKTVAKTAQELKAKYSRKRYTTKNLGLAFAAEYVYGLFLVNDGVSYEEQAEKHIQLFSNDASKKHAQLRSELNAEERKLLRAYESMLSLCRDNFQYAVQVRDSTVQGFMSIGYLLYDTLAVEAFLGEARTRGIDEEITRELSDSLSLRSFSEGGRRGRALALFRKSIEQNLRYILMHNTAIELMADAFSIPELTVFRVGVEQINGSQTGVNEFIADLRSNAETDGVGSKAEFFKTFYDIQPAPPIPQELIKTLKRDLKIYMSAHDCYMNLVNCYYYGRGLEAYSYG